MPFVVTYCVSKQLSVTNVHQGYTNEADSKIMGKWFTRTIAIWWCIHKTIHIISDARIYNVFAWPGKALYILNGLN